MADDKSPYRPRIKANAAESILPVAGLRGLRGHRAQTLQRCVKNVKEGRAVVTSLKVLESKREQVAPPPCVVVDMRSVTLVRRHTAKTQDKLYGDDHLCNIVSRYAQTHGS